MINIFRDIEWELFRRFFFLVDASLGISSRSNRLLKRYFGLLTAASKASVYSTSSSSIKLRNVLVTFCAPGQFSSYDTTLGNANTSVAEGKKLEPEDLRQTLA